MKSLSNDPTRFERAVLRLLGDLTTIDSSHFSLQTAFKPPHLYRKCGTKSQPDAVLTEQLSEKKQGFRIVIDAKFYQKASLKSTLKKTYEDMELRKALGLIIVGGAK